MPEEVGLIFDIQALKELLDKLSRAVGTTVSIDDLHGQVVVSSGFLKICREFHQGNEEGHQACRRHGEQLENELENGKPYCLSRCPRGLIDAASPILVEGRRVASVICGQFLLEPPDLEHFRAQASQLGFPESEYLAALSEVPILTRERLEAVLDFLASLAKMLGTIGVAHRRRDNAEKVLCENQERLELALEAGELGAWDWDVAGGRWVHDQRWARLLGYLPGEIDPRVSELAGLVHPEDVGRFQQTLEAVRQGKAGYVFGEFRLRHKLGDWIWLLKKGKVIERDPGGRPLRVCGTSMDITERRQLEDSLRQREREFSTLIEHSPDLIVRFDTQLRYLYCNKAVELQLDVAGSALIGKRPAEFGGSGEEAQFVESSLRRVLETGSEATVEQVLQTPGGWKFYQTRIVPERDKQQAIVSLLAVSREITALKLAEKALQESEERYRVLFEQSGDYVLLLELTEDGALTIIDANATALKAHQYSREELLGKPVSLLDRGLSPELVAERMRLLRSAGQVTLRLRHVRKDGSFFDVQSRSKIVKIGGKQLILSIEHDITEQLRAEEEREKLQAQLLQVQKMESVGRLAGGVAHDFNNMLGVIIGHAELAVEQLEAGRKPHECLQEILSAAWRSSDLTRQLLAFARRQVASPKVLDLNDAVESMLRMLRRLIGENIELNWKPGLNLSPVFMDPTHFGQILTNLAVNARDAIRGTGALSMETANVVLDQDYCAAHLGSVPGAYVLLAVSDTGSGMGQEIMEHMFEPFFTTKVMGQGTGLGLAMVYGIVKQNKGFIDVQSAPERGTTFRIYLPRTLARAAGQPATPSNKSLRGTETLLLVEDEKAILSLCQASLRRFGYQVLAARDPEEALQLERQHEASLHLLISDLVLPGMNGRDLARTFRSKRPRLKVLYISGYSPDAIAQQGLSAEAAPLLQKPFSVKILAEKVREVLDS